MIECFWKISPLNRPLFSDLGQSFLSMFFNVKKKVITQCRPSKVGPREVQMGERPNLCQFCTKWLLIGLEPVLLRMVPETFTIAPQQWPLYINWQSKCYSPTIQYIPKAWAISYFINNKQMTDFIIFIFGKNTHDWVGCPPDGNQGQ